MSTWVLLRGLTRERGHWGNFPRRLAEAAPGSRVITLDLPGAGDRRDVRCPWRVQDMAHDAREQLRHQGVPGPYCLLGLSLGGMVASAWAAAWPGEVAACVLVNTSMRPFSPLWHRLRPRCVPTLLRLLVTRDALAAEHRILRLTSTAPTHHLDVLEPWVAIRETRPVTASASVRQLVAAARYRCTEVRPEGVAVLVVCSAHDGLVNPRCSAALAQRWGVELLTHPAAGHDLPLDDAPWLIERVVAWSCGAG
jgi:pimeloyl-ACP methyl ester carboxylesterase